MAEFNKAYYRRQGKAEGIALERERIIKLLEDNARLREAHPVVWQNAIALIKGEK